MDMCIIVTFRTSSETVLRSLLALSLVASSVFFLRSYRSLLKSRYPW